MKEKKILYQINKRIYSLVKIQKKNCKKFEDSSECAFTVTKIIKENQTKKNRVIPHTKTFDPN